MNNVKIEKVEYTMKRALDELGPEISILDLSWTGRVYFPKKQEEMRLLAGKIRLSSVILDSSNTDLIELLKLKMEEMLISNTIFIKTSITSIENEFTILIEDFINVIAIKTALELTFIQDDVDPEFLENLKVFIEDNFDIKKIINNFSDMDTPKLDPKYRNEYEPLKMKENYMFNQQAISNEKKEYKTEEI